MSHPSTDGTDRGAGPKRRLGLSTGEIAALGAVFAVVGSVVSVVSGTQQLFQPFAGPGVAVLIWGIGALLALAVIVLLFTRWRTRRTQRPAPVRAVLWVIPLVLATGMASVVFGALFRSPPAASGPGGPSSSPTPSPTTQPAALSFAVIGECTEAGGELSAASGGFTPSHPYTVAVTGPDAAARTPGVPTPAAVHENGTVAWKWVCAGGPPGRYTTELVDQATGRSTGPVGFTVGSAATGPVPGPSTPSTTPATPTVTVGTGAATPAPTAAALPPPAQQSPVPFAFAPVGPVAWCADYHGTGTAPSAGRLVVLMLRRPGDQNYYYEKPVEFDGSGNWLADNVVVGNSSDTGLFLMHAYEVTPEQERESAKYVNEPAPVLGTLIRTTQLERSIEQNTC